MPITAITTTPSSKNSSKLANAGPRPSELASHARPRPAARPPSMAPQGLRAAAAAVPAAPAPAAVAPAWLVGAAGGVRAASRWVTLLDWRPMDLPPPMRRASASKVNTPTITTASSSVKKRETMCLRVILAYPPSERCERAAQKPCLKRG